MSIKALLGPPAATAGQERKGTLLDLPGHLQAGPLTGLSSQLWRLPAAERNEANHLAQSAIERLPPAHQAEPLAALLDNLSVLPRRQIHAWGVSWGRAAIGQLPPADRKRHLANLARLDNHAPPF